MTGSDPGELQLAEAMAPTPGVVGLPLGGVSTPSVPTPGASMTATRVPTAPTMPDGPPLGGPPTPSYDAALAQLAAQAFDPGMASPSLGGGVPAAPTTAAPLSTDEVVALLRADAEPPTPDAPTAPDATPYFLSAPSPNPNPTPSPTPSPNPNLKPNPSPTPSPVPTSAMILDLTGATPAGTARPSDSGGLDAGAVRAEFPILRERVHGKPLVWLDNAATTQKPQAVIDRLTHFYEHENSNIHRAAHTLAARATDAYEGARQTVARFLGARSAEDVIFVRGATEGINLVAQSWGRRNLEAGDEIVLTHLEHHANIVPWQLLAKEKGLRIRVAPVDDDGQIILEDYARLLGPRTKLVALPQVSNALGTITPAKAIIDLAHRHGAKVLLDGAQSVSHMRVDLQALDCDFFVFSGHKVFAPTGIGAVVGKADVLADMPPWQGGGNMIADVTFERTIFHGPPARFEAGTGSIGDAAALGTALEWLERVGIERVEAHEHDLLVYGTARLREIAGLRIIGTAREKAGVLSFVIDGHSTHDLSTALDQEGIAVRGGHHCAQPILRRMGVETSVRASLAPYNTTGDLDALVDALHRIVDGRRR